MKSQQEAEDKVMLEWREDTQTVVEVWLQKYEKETDCLVNPPEQMDNVEHFATEMEVSFAQTINVLFNV